MKINKSILKSNYYWEFTDLYDSLPDELEVPTYAEHVFTETISHTDILKTYVKKMFTIEQAFAVAADYAQSGKKDYRIVYFEHKGVPCRLNVWRSGDGELRLSVRRVNLGVEWDAGDGVLCSTETSEPSGPVDPLPVETLTLERAIDIVVMAGYKVSKE